MRYGFPGLICFTLDLELMSIEFGRKSASHICVCFQFGLYSDMGQAAQINKLLGLLLVADDGMKNEGAWAQT